MADVSEGRIRCPNCAKRYRWKPELANRKVQCKECGQKLRLPDDPTGQAVALEPPPADSDASTYGIRMPDENNPHDTSAGAAPPASASTEDDAPAGKTCPSCKASLKAEAVLCVHCGYNLQRGKKLKTQVRNDEAEQTDREGMTLMDKFRDMRENGELPMAQVILVLVMLLIGLGVPIWYYFIR